MNEEIKNEALQTLEETAAPEIQEIPKESQAEINFKALREEKARSDREREQMQRERDEAIRYAQMAMQAQQPRQQVPEEPELRPDDLVEARHFQKKIKELRDEVDTFKRESSVNMIESQLKAKYSDFDSVVSKANLDALQQQYPEIHKTIYTSQDLYAKGATAYQLIQKFLTAPVAQTNSNDQKQMQKNAAKPKSLNTVNASQPETPLDRARLYSEGLTEEMKKQIYDHMQAHATKKNIQWTQIK